MTSPVRRAARSVVAAAIRHRLERSDRQVGLALVFHAVGPVHGDADRELVPPLGLALFERQIQHVRRHYAPVLASQFCEAVSRRRPREPIPVAVTFDDDLVSHAELALPVLRRLGVPATFFIGGAALRGPRIFWWETLQAAFDARIDLAPLARRLDTTITGPTDIRRVAAAMQQLASPELAEVADELAAQLPEPIDPPRLSRAQIAALAQADMEIGFHTAAHAQLTSLDDGELDEALNGGREEVRAAVGAPIDTIAYPHGVADERVAEHARAADYRAGFMGTGGAWSSGQDPLLVGRTELHTPATSYFRLSMARALRG